MRLQRLGAAVVLASFLSGCGNRGDLAAGIPEGAFDSPRPQLSDAQLKMKEQLAKQGGVAPMAKRSGGSYIDKMKGSFNAGGK